MVKLTSGIALDGEEYRQTCLKALGHLSLDPINKSPEGDSIARIFRTYSTGGVDLPDLWSPDKHSIKQESTSPRLSLPRTPIPRRPRSMIISPYTCSTANRDSRMKSKIARPLLSSFHAVEERFATVQAKPSSAAPPTPPRTPVLRVKRRKRPPPSPRTPVLGETSKANTPSPWQDPTISPFNNKHTITTSSTSCVIAKSIGQLMLSPAAARLILVDGRDAARVAKLRDDVQQLKREQTDPPIRMIDSHMINSQSELDSSTVDRYTICTI